MISFHTILLLVIADLANSTPPIHMGDHTISAIDSTCENERGVCSNHKIKWGVTDRDYRENVLGSAIVIDDNSKNWIQ